MNNQDLDGLMKNLEATLRQSANFEWYMRNVLGVAVELLHEIAKRLPETKKFSAQWVEDEH